MKKFLRISAIAAGIILLFLIIGYFSIKIFLTPAKLNVLASKVLSETVQQPVTLGRVSLTIGFKIGITINDISITNVHGFSSAPLLQIKRVTLNLKLLPLLKRQIAIGSIDIAGLKANFERNKEGKSNIPVIIVKEAKGPGWSLRLSSIEIINAEIDYADALSNIEMHIKDLHQNIEVRGNKFTVNGKQGLYIAKSKIIPEMTLEIINNITYDTLSKDLTVKKLIVAYGPVQLEALGSIKQMKTLDINANLKIDDMNKLLPLIPVASRPEQINGILKAKATVGGTTQAPLIDGRCELKNMAITLKGMNRGLDNIQGSLSFTQNAIENIAIQGQLGKTKLTITGSIENIKNLLLNLNAKIDGNLQDFNALTNETAKMNMIGSLNGNITVKGAIANPAYFGDLSIHDAQIEVGLAKPITNLNIQVNLQNDAAIINQCSGRIGQSDFSLSGHISNFKKPIIQINNKSNLIDLDELLPKEKEKGKKEGKGIPIVLQGPVQINKLKGLDMEFKNINTNFSYENGIIDLKNCSAETFDGKVNLDFYYNSNNPEPYRIASHMNSVSTQKILKRFLNFENIEGTLTGVSNFQGKGFIKKEAISNLSASGNLKINNGIFKNFKLLTELLAWLGLKDYKEVKLNELVCNFKIENGKMKVTDWTLASGIGNFLTNGMIGLDGYLDLSITTTLPKKESDIIKKYHGDWLFYFDNRGQAIIDIIVSGNMKTPEFSLDKARIKDRLSGKLKDEFEKKKKEWESKLKGLFR